MPTVPARAATCGTFSSVLVANRGEIVVRVCRTLAARSMRSVAVYTGTDAGALHVRVADLAIEVPSYLDADALVAAAKAAAAEAVHPGYGFLSEDAQFARAVVGAGLVWIGPPPDAIEAMGDKLRAKAMVERAGVPVVPGAGAPGMSDEEVASAALEIGLPVLLKPSAGGGGKGMRRVTSADELPAAIAAARREADGAFGDGTLLVERWVQRPRHVEVQVFADSSGQTIHLGERECSLQRRHQKIVEESPSPLLDDATRDAMTASAVSVARAVGYVGAGTVEFIVSGERPDEYYFMEMNTRLQVEHPVTEMVTGIDLVDWQLQVASGAPLPLAQDQVRFEGHGVEARVYAEDPSRGFLPTGGTVALALEPTGRQGVRVDSSLVVGTVVGSRYDPMLAKVIAWGPTRGDAFARLRSALEETTILGVTTNVGYLARLVSDPAVTAGQLDTELVDRTLPELVASDERDDAEAAVAAVARIAAELEPDGRGTDPWEVPDGWRVSGTGGWSLHLRGDARSEGSAERASGVVVVRGRLAAPPEPSAAPARVSVGGTSPMLVSARFPEGVDGPLEMTVDGTTRRWRVALAGDELWVGLDGRTWRFVRELEPRGERLEGRAGAGPVTSPMPGVVAAVNVSAGDQVQAGHVLVVVEAMKMQHAVRAPADGVVSAVLVRPGQIVGLDEPLAEVG